VPLAACLRSILCSLANRCLRAVYTATARWASVLSPDA
jgi:hypothetical protein